MTPKSAFCERHGRSYDASLHTVCPDCRAAAAGASLPRPSLDPRPRDARTTARLGEASPAQRPQEKPASDAGSPAARAASARPDGTGTAHGIASQQSGASLQSGASPRGGASALGGARTTAHGGRPSASGGRTTATAGRPTVHGRTTARAEARPSQLKTQRPRPAAAGPAPGPSAGIRLHGFAALALFALAGVLGYREWAKTASGDAQASTSSSNIAPDAGPLEAPGEQTQPRRASSREEPERARPSRSWPAIRHRARRGHVAEVCRIPWAELHGREPTGEPDSARDEQGRTPLTAAAESGSIEELERLLASGARVDERDARGHTPLTSAALRGRDAHVQALMRAGADARARALWDAEGGSMSALDAALSQGALGTARLIEHDVLESFRVLTPDDLSAIDEAGDTPLHWVARYAEAKAAKLLIQRGAELELANCPARPGDEIGLHAGDLRAATPLLVAIWAGNTGVARVLLDAGADTRAVDERGRGVFHVVRHSESLALTRELLRAGADPLQADRDGRTPPEALAASGLRTELERELAAAGRPIPAAPASIIDLMGVITRLGTTRGTAPERDDPAPVIALLDADATLVSATDARGRTALFEAAAQGLPRVAEALVARGARADARDSAGRTPLHAARDARIITELVRLGASTGARDGAGSTPLHLQAARRGSLEAVTALIAAGASTNVRDRGGRTPLDLARASGSPDVVLYLEEH